MATAYGDGDAYWWAHYSMMMTMVSGGNGNGGGSGSAAAAEPGSLCLVPERASGL